MMPFTGCPICGYPDFLELTPQSRPTYDICPCCGFESGVSYSGCEVGERDRKALQDWLEGGAKWWSTVRPPPSEWNAADQLRAAGRGEDGGYRLRVTEERQRTLSKAIDHIAQAKGIIEAFQAGEEAYLADVRELVVYGSKANAISAAIYVLDDAAIALSEAQERITNLIE